MDWTDLTIKILEYLKYIGGSYGMAIILLTVLVRLVLLPLSVSQQSSMKKMQALAPKLKQIQNTYKNDPQKLQQKMMEFYKEHNFNPLGGCLPLLAQMPVLILLYTTLVSIPFLQVAGSSSFLFINRLDATMQTHAGKVENGTFSVIPSDKFIPAPNKIEVYSTQGKTLASIKDYATAITSKPSPLVPGKPVNLILPLDKLELEDTTITKTQIQTVIIPIIIDSTKEIETIKFIPDFKTQQLTATVKTVLGKNVVNFDVVILLALFVITMYISQKIMTSMSTAPMDEQQKAMQESMSKTMPLVILAMFIFVPIPAGVLLYMVVSNIITVGQTAAINKYLDYEEAKKKKQIATSPVKGQSIIDSDDAEEDLDDDDDSKHNGPIITHNPRSRKSKRKKNRKFNK